MGIHPSRVVITRLTLDKAAEKILEGQARSRPVGRRANTREERLRRCRGRRTSCTTFIKDGLCGRKQGRKDCYKL